MIGCLSRQKSRDIFYMYLFLKNLVFVQSLSLAAVLLRRHRRVENDLAIGQVDAVLAEVLQPFRLVPSDHPLIVATKKPILPRGADFGGLIARLVWISG